MLKKNIDIVPPLQKVTTKKQELSDINQSIFFIELTNELKATFPEWLGKLSVLNTRSNCGD